jgi:signal transduction histidine kinase/ActR/RegA family two-component response regulator
VTTSARALASAHAVALPHSVFRLSELRALGFSLLMHSAGSREPDDRVAAALKRTLGASASIKTGATLDDLLREIVDHAIAITRAERACIVLFDTHGAEESRIVGSAPLSASPLREEDISTTVLQRVVHSRAPLLLHDVFDDHELLGRPSITSLSLRSILCVPLQRGGHLYGVLYIDSSNAAGSFDATDLEILSLFAEQVAAALEISRLVTDLQRSMTDLKSMQERLIRGERLRTIGELSSSVAHEFNNLLTSILARVQLMGLSPQPAETVRDLQLIEAACLDAARVVRRLQSVGGGPRSEADGPVNFSTAVHEAVEFLRPIWTTRRRHGRPPILVRAEIQEGVIVTGDPTELREVVTNLLKNSVEALSEGGSIRVALESSQGMARLTVRDDGPGIPPEIQHKLFDPFFTTKGERGTGLGLCICRQIAERHAGTITLESGSGSGTLATFQVPLDQAGRAEPRAVADARSRKALVLVVDDDENVLIPLGRYLQESGYEVELASSGTAAIQKSSRRKPDAVISDISMPGMSGIEFCRQHREAWGNVPVILMTGRATVSTRFAAEEARAYALLAKPFSMQQALDTLEAAIAASSAEHSGAS